LPRKAREKHSEAIYHIMCRSVSEILLFRDNDDRDYYLKLLKRYADKYRCSVYAYCLMSTHLHIHFDPKGYDISKSENPQP
jgi:putative transposase